MAKRFTLFITTAWPWTIPRFAELSAAGTGGIKMKTSKKQLALVRDWEKRNPEQAQARKNEWAKSAKGRAWLKANQKKKNKARDAWRERQKALKK